ncbi:AAA family ATPase [Sphingorhabdus lutea]|uniref:Replication-associated recombination protein A n=1 Tax=Sphingorhabdus lutea TaxID=1913578 RepID=A0A1L3JD37_9SPHN|nr:replication-associated recombination protein A [Sphingorhabdus lutea]APG63051.1 AAA family ATPase [Sphingorhabdus lutea]
MSDLFGKQDEALHPHYADIMENAPLAEKLRPHKLDQIIGQGHLTGAKGAINLMVKKGQLSSIILWGPPGTGKTSIARLIAAEAGYYLIALSAIFSGVADLKKAFADARKLSASGKKILMFVDEIHRFNRAQQDAFLPVVEQGTVTLIGATTENPSFELNAALLSRMQVLTLNRLRHDDLDSIISHAEKSQNTPLPINEQARKWLIDQADGDARFLINQIETIFNICEQNDDENGIIFDLPALSSLLQRRAAIYDKKGDGHYNLISALHKSLRGSDADAALYWMARMLVAGEDPIYVLRRLVRFASEDIGLADPQALTQCLAALQSYQLLGSPEGELAIVQACLYCATAPKSNAAYVAQKNAWKLAAETGSLSPPASILNAPTKMMKEMGYGAGYEYDHDSEHGFSGANYWPDGIERRALYQPVSRGYERKVQEHMAYWEKLRAQKNHISS